MDQVIVHLVLYMGDFNMKTLGKIIRFTVFMTIFISLLSLTSKVFTPQWVIKNKQVGQIYTIKGFYEEKKNSIDVLFIGDSNLYKGISPLKLYEDYGIASYNYGVSSARIYTMYHLMQSALEYQKPKIIIMDTATMFYKNMEKEPERRKSFDYMPFSKTKLNMISDKVFENDLEEKLSYIFPIFRYHSRWNEITNDEVIKLARNYHYYTKGYFFTDIIAPQKGDWEHMKENTKALPKMQPYTEEYFKKTIEYCKDHNITLIMLGLPDKRTWKYQDSKSMQEYAEKYGVVFLDLNKDTYKFNWKTDTSDKPGVHANIYGAEKMTKVVGDYLHTNYDLKDHRGEEEYQSWDKDLKKYQEKRTKAYTKLEKLENEKNKINN